MHFNLDFETTVNLRNNAPSGSKSGNIGGAIEKSLHAGRDRDEAFSSNPHEKRANPHAKKPPKYSTAPSILNEVLESRCDCNKNDATKHSCFSNFSEIDAEKIRSEWDYDYAKPSCPINENTMNQRLVTYLRSHQMESSGFGTLLCCVF